MTEWANSRGYSGAAFDRQVIRTEQSPLEKVKEQYWTAKQVVLQKLGKKEDDHLVASDAELDAKLELFRSIKTSSGSLKRIAGRYQRIMHEISREEYSLGMFLKKHGENDTSRAGDVLKNVAKAFAISAQKRMELVPPLSRLAEDCSTYQKCAVADSERKISQMEDTRTAYRGALLWMKKVSEELDPDTYRQLEKFRKVQGQVREKKAKFDSQKLDTLQRIDLLAISRLNMLSQSLSPYGKLMFDYYEHCRQLFGSVPIPPITSTEFENKLIASQTQRRERLTKASSGDGEGDALLDLSPSDPGPSLHCSSSELLDSMWNDFQSASANFDLLASGTNLLGLESGDGIDNPTASTPEEMQSTFNFADLDDTEKGTLEFDSVLLGAFGSPKRSPAGTGDVIGKTKKSFLPSQLLQKGWMSSMLGSSSQTGAQDTASSSSAREFEKMSQESSKNQNWYNLFADLDPLANRSQETVPKTGGDQSGGDGSC